MMGRTHLLLGLSSLWLLEGSGVLNAGTLNSLLNVADNNRFLLCLVACGVGSLLPDLDASTSLLQNLTVGGIRPLILPARVLHRQFGHRGFLHSFLALGLVALSASPLLQIDFWVWLSLSLGYLSHLLGDACTKSGVPLLYPRHRVVHLLPRPWRLTTGSLAEEAIFGLLAIGALTLLLRHLLKLPLPA